MGLNSAIARSELFSSPFPFLFPGPSTLATLLTDAKRGMLSMGKAWKWDLDQIIGTMGHFTTIFAPKLVTFFQFATFIRVPSISKTDCCADKSILAPLSAYQKYPVTFNVAQKAPVPEEGWFGQPKYSTRSKNILRCVGFCLYILHFICEAD